MERWRACRMRKVLGAYDVLKSCTVLPNTKQLITAQKTCQLSRALHTQKDKHGQNCRLDYGVNHKLEMEEAVHFTKITPTSGITSQSVVHNIAELKRVGIVQPSALNHRWFRLVPTLSSYLLKSWIKLQHPLTNYVILVSFKAAK